MNTTKLLVGAGFLLCSSAYAAPMCATDTLANYIGLGSGGCMVGPILRFKDFSFSVLSSSGGADPISAGGITVSPVISGPKFGLTFASAGFTIIAGRSIQYLVGYTIDEPPIIHGFELDLADPPTPPGISSITSVQCLGAAFSGSTCPASTITQTTSDNGVTASLTDIKLFAPVGILGDRTTITLDAHLGGKADITSFTELAIVPEPAAASLAGAGMLLFCVARVNAVRTKRRRRC